MVNEKEMQLNSFDRNQRISALGILAASLRDGSAESVQEIPAHNLHCHTFFSYNGYGYSPSFIAWKAKEKGLFAAGVVDFDVLDATAEFLEAADMLNLRGVSGIETRVFIRELADVEINSPGEPGIAYHMGVGFTGGEIPEDARAFLEKLRCLASDRTKAILERVNSWLDKVQVDYERDVLSLTPKGNATERHLCQAYYLKAEQIFPDQGDRVTFWAEKLSVAADEIRDIISDPVALQGLIRSKTMKSGGVGYVKPDPRSFPALAEMNDFIQKCGAIPTLAWLNGESGGEKELDRLLDLHISQGMAVVNIIPDRNWNYSDPAVRKAKIAELNRFVKAASERDLPIIVGTEMNAPGQKFVDDFDSEALAPLTDIFVDGAAIVYAHTKLQPLGFGYLSEWASANFADNAEKNSFFAAFGRVYKPDDCRDLASRLSSGAQPAELLSMIVAE